ncbi:MAG: hypothetical protein MUC29_11700 [Pyrinomonadaceae bacterium]|jgi:hypothetical protein|nr:hypothetical protein [Pyrinomonadaceae bacterium]
MFINSSLIPKSWLAFELNVLRRLKFNSVALPLAGEPSLGAYLKRWNVRVSTNDLLISSCTKSVANIQNNYEKLSDEDVDLILEDVYVPRYRLQNQALRNWFNETDAWWFDNIKRNILKLQMQTAQAIAATIVMAVGDYVLSFDDNTLELRQPLSTVFRRIWSSTIAPVSNSQNNPVSNKTPNDFIAENYTELMFLRLPKAHNMCLRESLGKRAWQEEWVRGNDTFWEELDMIQTGRLGTHVATKSQYLHLVKEILKTATHIPTWAIAHVEDGFISSQDITETISQIRVVDTIYTKDFSELTGSKAVIITA